MSQNFWSAAVLVSLMSLAATAVESNNKKGLQRPGGGFRPGVGAPGGVTVKPTRPVVVRPPSVIKPIKPPVVVGIPPIVKPPVVKPPIVVGIVKPPVKPPVIIGIVKPPVKPPVIIGIVKPPIKPPVIKPPVIKPPIVIKPPVKPPVIKPPVVKPPIVIGIIKPPKPKLPKWPHWPHWPHYPKYPVWPHFPHCPGVGGIVVGQPYPVYLPAGQPGISVLNLQCALPEGGTVQDLNAVNVNLMTMANGQTEVFGVINDGNNQTQTLTLNATGSIVENEVNLKMANGDEVYLQAVQGEDGKTYYQGSLRLLGHEDKNGLVCQLTQLEQ